VASTTVQVVMASGDIGTASRRMPRVKTAQQMTAPKVRRSPGRVLAPNDTPRAATTRTTPTDASASPSAARAVTRSRRKAKASPATIAGMLASTSALLLTVVSERPRMKHTW
jgi:hypothetical protein